MRLRAVFQGVVTGLALTLAAGGQTASPPSPRAPQVFRISGNVVDATTGGGLGGARVSIAPVDNRDDARTIEADDNGRFLFENVTAGKWALNAERRGYVSQAYEQHDQYSTSIVTGPGLDSEDLVFRLRPESSISGKVTDEYGEPVRDARVMLFQFGLQNGQRAVFIRSNAITNDLGGYRFSHLAAGRYYVGVSAAPWYARHAVADENAGAAGDASPTGVAHVMQQESSPALDVAYPLTFYPSAISSDGAGPIALSAGDRFTADIAMRPVAALHLRVPVNGPESEDSSTATVRQRVFNSILVPVHAESRKVGTDMVTISGIPPGQYVLDVNTWTNSRPSARSSREIDATSDGQLLPGPDQTLVPVRGVVKIEGETDGAVAGRGIVQLRNRKTSAPYRARISANGEFEFRQQFPAGDYNLDLANVRGFTVKRITSNARVTGETIRISGKAPVNLTLEITGVLGRVDGVVQHDGKPLAAVMVVLVPEDPANNTGYFRRDQTDSDGSFTLSSVLPGKYTLLAIENGWNLEWADPEALKPYMASGEVIQVEAQRRYKVKLKAK